MKDIRTLYQHEEVTKKNKAPSRVSNDQKVLLVELLEQNKGLANGKLDAHTSGEKWEEIAEKLNSLNGSKKSSSLWRKFWTSLKRNTGKKAVICTEIRRSRRFKIQPVPLKDLDNRILAIIKFEENDNMEIVPKEESHPVNQGIIIEVPDSPPIEGRRGRDKQDKRYLRFLRRMDKRLDNRWEKLLNVEQEKVEIKKKKLEAMQLNNALLQNIIFANRNANGIKTIPHSRRN